MLNKNFLTAIGKRFLILGWFALATMFIGQLGKWHWFAELFSHFTPYYTVCFFLACFAATHLWQRLFFITITLACTVWLCTPIPKLWLQPFGYCFTPSWHIVSYNLWVSNPQKELESGQLLQTIQTDAHILFLTEFNNEWEKHLRSLKQFDHCSVADESPFGLALFSREPLVQCEVLYMQGSGSIPYIRAVLSHGLIIYGVHLPPPLNRTLALERNAMMQELATMVQKETGDVIVLGDMNVTPFSPVFRDFIAAAGLHETSLRITPTWKPGLLGVDHILVSNPDAVINAGAFPWQYSDHRPVWMRYSN